MESDDNVSGEFQRSTRMPLDAVVRLHFQGTVAYQNGFAANVSATGMFVKHPAPPPLGTQLVFEFNLGADRKPVQGAGEVVWVREKYLGPGQPAGVGIRFLQLDSQSRDHIAEALFEYLEQSLAEDSLLDSSAYPFGQEAPSATAGTPGDGAAEAAPPTTGGAPYEYAPVAAAARPVGDLFGGLEGGSGESDRGPEAIAEPYSQPFDFAALERLPYRSPTAGAAEASGLPAAAERADPGTADGRRAFSVFSPLDEADPQTADIVREALREEAPMPSMAAAAAASSEQERSNRWVVWVILALVAGGGYFAWQQWGSELLAGRSEADAVPAPAASDEPPAARRPQPLNAAPEPGTTLAQAVGVDPNAVSAAAAPPLSTPAPAPTPDEADEAEDAAAERSAPGATNLAADAALALAADTAPPAFPTDPAPADSQPRPPAAPVEATAAPAPATPSATAGATQAQRLTGIEWRESAETAGATVLVLAGDGAFRTGSFSYSEIGGENPRVLVKLKGMASPYRGATPRAPQAGGALVRGVRTGFHVTPSGNEIHVVVDLARRGIQVSSLAPAETGLVLVLAP